MFKAELLEKDGLHIIVLSDRSNRIEILPSCGGIMNAWQIMVEGAWKNIVSGYDDQLDFDNNCEKKGFRGCKLSPYVCRIKDGKYKINELEHTIGKFGFDHHNIHGLIYNSVFENTSTHSNNTEALASLVHHYKGNDIGYPYNYSIEIKYKLQSHNQLIIETKLTNHHTEAIPISDGWHPYFTLGSLINDCTLKIKSNTLLEFDAELIPTGQVIIYSKFQDAELINNTVLDNCFVLDPAMEGPACVFADEVQGIKLEIYPDDSYPYLQIYTPDDRQSIAIENLSAAPDAFNNKIGLIYLEPGEEKVFRTQYVFSEMIGIT